MNPSLVSLDPIRPDAIRMTWNTIPHPKLKASKHLPALPVALPSKAFTNQSDQFLISVLHKSAICISALLLSNQTLEIYKLREKGKQSNRCASLSRELHA